MVFYNCSLSPYLIDFTYLDRAEWHELNRRSQSTMRTTKVCGFPPRITSTIDYLFAYTSGIREVHGPEDPASFVTYMDNTRSSLTIFTCVVILCKWPARVASLMSLIHLIRFARWSYALACDHRLPIRPPSHLFAIYLLTRKALRSRVNTKRNCKPGKGSCVKGKNGSSGP